jgi:small subunit ribosomal protein S7
MQVGSKRQQSLAFRWIIQSARSKKGKPMAQRLASELLDAYNGQGGAMTTRENVHRMAEANKAFAHFAW